MYQKDLDFQKALNATIMETQEQVLNNIAQDLHDDAGQQLTYINFQLENLKLDFPDLKENLEPLSQSVGSLSQSIRSVSHSLSNQLLLQQDLIKAIQTEVERLRKNPKMEIGFTVDKALKKEFTVNEKIIIYRIFQEIINNCFKHAKATKIDIHMQVHPVFAFSVSDNGKGFDLLSLERNKNTLGLKNMENRAAIINYELNIKTRIGEGTTISLTEKQ